MHHPDQLLAIALWRELTVKRTLKQARRCTSILGLPAPCEGLRDLPEEFCTAWNFNVGRHFAAALDILLQCRKKDKRDYYVWTQGSAFNFTAGYTIPSRDGTLIIQVDEATPAEPSSSGIARNPGYVRLRTHMKSGGPNAWNRPQVTEMTQDSLVHFLITGRLEGEHYE